MGHATCMGRLKINTKVWSENLKGIYVGEYERIMSKWIIEKQDVKSWTIMNCLRVGSSSRLL